MSLDFQPVSVFVGLGFPRVVDSVGAALSLLDEWPAGSRGPLHARATSVCRDALIGAAQPNQARAALIQFAQARGMLANEAIAASAAAVGREWFE